MMSFGCRSKLRVKKSLGRNEKVGLILDILSKKTKPWRLARALS